MLPLLVTLLLPNSSALSLRGSSVFSLLFKLVIFFCAVAILCFSFSPSALLLLPSPCLVLLPPAWSCDVSRT